MSAPYDCIVIGAGPGGLVAAIYLQRLRRRVLLIDGGPARASRIPKIRNLVGYDEGISGIRLLKRLHRQYAKYGGELLCARATVSRRGRGFEVKAGDRRLRARKVILATGMRDIEPPFGELKELTAKGLIGYCPICDGFDHRDQKLALFMTDPRALKKVRFMSGFTSRLVVVLMRKSKLHPAHQKLIRRHSCILLNGPPKSVREAKGGGLVLNYPGRKQVKVDAAYVMMGTQVPRDAVSSIRNLKRVHGGFLSVTSHQETSVKGLFAVGDCVSALSQVSVAAGHAAIAATHVHNSL